MSVTVAVDDTAPGLLAIGGVTKATGVVTANDSGTSSSLLVQAFRAGPDTALGAFYEYILGSGPAPAVVYEATGKYGTLLMTYMGAWEYRLATSDPETLALGLGEIASDVFTYRLYDGGATDLGQLTVNIIGVNSLPAIDSDGGGRSASIAVHEGVKTVTTVHATDLEGTALTYRIIGGADAGKFKIDASTGKLSFKAAPDFEAPRDAGRNNVYDVVVSASDGVADDTQAIAVRVQDVSARVIGKKWIDVVTAGPLGRAGNGDDVIRGKGGSDWLSAGAGNDLVDGGRGNDVINGGRGHDQLIGGSGKDFFVFADRPGAANADTVEDFTHDWDMIVLQRSDFSRLNWGALREPAFDAADGATAADDASDRIVYDTASGALYYDPDGVGGAAARHFATFKGAPELDAGDFLIV